MDWTEVSLRWPGRPATLEDVRRQYALPRGVLDEDFGIRCPEPERGEFVVRVAAELAPRLEHLVSSPGTVPLKE